MRTATRRFVGTKGGLMGTSTSKRSNESILDLSGELRLSHFDECGDRGLNAILDPVPACLISLIPSMPSNAAPTTTLRAAHPVRRLSSAEAIDRATVGRSRPRQSTALCAAPDHASDEGRWLPVRNRKETANGCRHGADSMPRSDFSSRATLSFPANDPGVIAKVY